MSRSKWPPSIAGLYVLLLVSSENTAVLQWAADPSWSSSASHGKCTTARGLPWLWAGRRRHLIQACKASPVLLTWDSPETPHVISFLMLLNYHRSLIHAPAGNISKKVLFSLLNLARHGDMY